MGQTVSFIRAHGLQRPLEKMQLIAWTTVVICIALFFVFCVPFEPDRTNQIIYSAVYCSIFAIGLAFFFRVSAFDPCHPHVYNPEESKPPEEETYRSCTRCRIYMQPDTKHCNICHKCISGFDHHCLYLNTCIGDRNYRSFFVLISCCMSLMVIQVAMIIHRGILYDSAESRPKLDEWNMDPTTYLVVIVCTGVFPLISLLLIGSLWLFHVYISIRGISTYKWIQDRRKLAEERRAERVKAEYAAKEAELEQRREEERARWQREQSQRKLKQNSRSNVHSDQGMEMTSLSSPSRVSFAAASSTLLLSSPVSSSSYSTIQNDPSTAPSSSLASPSSTTSIAITQSEHADSSPSSLNQAESERKRKSIDQTESEHKPMETVPETEADIPASHGRLRTSSVSHVQDVVHRSSISISISASQAHVPSSRRASVESLVTFALGIADTNDFDDGEERGPTIHSEHHQRQGHQQHNNDEAQAAATITQEPVESVVSVTQESEPSAAVNVPVAITQPDHDTQPDALATESEPVDARLEDSQAEA